MNYFLSNYKSKLGDIVLISDDNNLLYLFFKDFNKFESVLKNNFIYSDSPIISKVKKQLDEYFQNLRTDFDIKIKLKGTNFQKRVWSILLDVKYGNYLTYKDVANIYKEKYHCQSMSYRAIAKAISLNPILIIIPCHRILGSDLKLKGYSGSLKNKAALLSIENIFYI